MRPMNHLLLAVLLWLISSPSLALGGDIRLSSSRGGDYALTDSRGKVVVLSFGYTFCPDVCPTALSTIAAALAMIGPDVDEVDGLFVSLDPERDTVEKLRDYTQYFHPSIQGLTGDASALSDIAARYKVRYNFVGKGSREFYTMDHGSNLFILDADGKVFRILPHGLPPHVLADGIRAALTQRNMKAQVGGGQ